MVDRSLLGAVACALLVVSQTAGQEIDSNVTTRNRAPAVIADQIADPTERADFIALYQKIDARTVLLRAEAFLAKYPRSAFLAQAYEIAARGCFDTSELSQGLEYARQSLALLPENPLLLVAVADVQASQHQNDAAIKSASDALAYLDEFAHPDSISEEQWPEVKQRQKGTAYFAVGRARFQMAMSENSKPVRQKLLSASIDSLAKASSINPRDEEIAYLLGLAHLVAGNLPQAAVAFKTVYEDGGDYAPRALTSLQEIYKAQGHSPAMSFQAFLDDVNLSVQSAHQDSPTSSAAKLSEYAGSTACRDCHAATYRNWSETGMAKMLRPYERQNVVGDFLKNNEFYTGDDVQYLHGKLNVVPGADHKLFARMVVRSGKHYFDIRQSDGRWHSYPVDYTIGSKWQQAYATKLPTGQIHVFPIQYSVIEKKWVNYWKSLDGPGSERSNPYNFERLDDSTSYQEKCAVCHTSQLRNTKGGGLEADGLEFREAGIGCEMCHGPSAAHIAAMTRGEFYEKAALDPPVDFRKISGNEFVSICAQCHMQARLRDPGPHGELNYSASGQFFQQTLSVPFGEFTRKGFYKDGRFSQTTFIVEALERSKCFRQGQISCGTCHDPHGHGFSANQTSLRFKDEPDKMCTSCHNQFLDKTKIEVHTHHASNSEASQCISCHMPRIMDALTFSARTHQIDDIPNAETTIRFGQEDSPNACLLCHKDKSPQWAQGQLQSWNANSQTISGVAIKRP